VLHINEKGSIQSTIDSQKEGNNEIDVISLFSFDLDLKHLCSYITITICIRYIDH